MPERRRKITKATVDALSPGEIAWDGEIKGFGVRCQRRDRSLHGERAVWRTSVVRHLPANLEESACALSSPKSHLLCQPACLAPAGGLCLASPSTVTAPFQRAPELPPKPGLFWTRMSRTGRR